MFKLGGEGFVSRYSGPAILQDLDICAAKIEHGFNGKKHAGLKADAAARLAIMEDVWRGVELLAKAMAAKISDNSAALALGI